MNFLADSMGDILEIKTRACLLADEQRIATHLLKQVDDLQKTQNILGHKNIRTTEIYPPLEDSSVSGGFTLMYQTLRRINC